MLKRRFPVLAMGIRLNIDTAGKVIVACCILHNICIFRKESEPVNDGCIPQLEEAIIRGQIPSIPSSTHDKIHGFKRNQVIQYFETMNTN